MDKLKPIITHRFWILAGLCIPLAMYGFFSANSKLKAATEEREGTLKQVFSGVSKGTTDPNEKYAEGLSKINDAYKKNVDEAILAIWEAQQARMTWPPVVDQYVPAKFIEGEFDFKGIVAYKEAYERLMHDLQERVEPVMPLESAAGFGGVGGNLGALNGLGPRGLGGGPGALNIPQQADVPWKQKVILAAMIPQARFGEMRPSSEQVWNAQIDIWLLSLIFDSVKRLNEDKDSVTEAILRRIDRLELVGGDGTPILTGGGTTGGEGSYGGDSYGGEMENYNNGGGEYGGGGSYGGGTNRATSAVPISFDVAQEFGSSVGASSTTEESSNSYGGSTEMGMGASNAPRVRYIADAEDKPFLERGFYMSVIIMQDKIPDFLVELANSEWPVRVTRFHVGKNPYYDEAKGNINLDVFNSEYGGEYPGFGGGRGEYGGESEMSDRGSSMEMTLGGGFGGVGGMARGIPGIGGLSNNLPPFADAAMQNSNLVQLDLCGIITMFKQPESIVSAIENGESATTNETSSTSADPGNAAPATDSLPAGDETTDASAPADADNPETPASSEPAENPVEDPAQPVDSANDSGN